MNYEKFAYWCQGFFEMTDAQELTKTQVKILREHLDLCFNKITPTKIEQQPFSAFGENIKLNYEGFSAGTNTIQDNLLYISGQVEKYQNKNPTISVDERPVIYFSSCTLSALTSNETNKVAEINEIRYGILELLNSC